MSEQEQIPEDVKKMYAPGTQFNDGTSNPQPDEPMQPAEPGVGDLMKEGARKAIAGLVVLLLIVAYLGGLGLCRSTRLEHVALRRSTRFADVGIPGNGDAGIVSDRLPLALHYWAFDPTHRLATFICYGIDLVLLGMNSLYRLQRERGTAACPVGAIL